MRAFIVRPFGAKEGIDFERVEHELIAPVLDELSIDGRTTQEIARAGNIRTDMFERLLLADVVIADISIHNANVYYELGVRHALRPRTTILIRARADDVPFDLRTDRYLEYARDDPGHSRPGLADALGQSVRADKADSPVFLLLPALKPHDKESLRPVPEAFAEAVRNARRSEDRPMLAVLAEEAEMFDWALAGARLVARAQFALSAWPDTRATLEFIRAARPDDPEANLLLGTVFQRLGRPVESSAALERVVGGRELTLAQQAEGLALLGRNAKDRWIAEWAEAPRERRPAAALHSAFLESARQAYDEAFLVDQNHWYSGLNALSMATVALRLAQRAPDAWAERYADGEQMTATTARLERERAELEAAVRRSLDAESFRSRRRGEEDDVWAALSRADLRLLTSDKPGYVADGYRQARARLSQDVQAGFPAESAARQLRLYLQLDVFTQMATAALEALGVSAQPPVPPPRTRVIVFSGHRIDAPDRPRPRFPEAAAERAAEMIHEAVSAEQQLAGSQPIEGIAGGASGGDILFHETCAELGIPTSLLLALPRDGFAAESVNDAGPDWMERFRMLCERLEVKVLSDSTQLPSWLAEAPDYSIWQRNNRWILHTALSRSQVDVTLIVLWDGGGGDGLGGTADMVRLARARGVRVVHLDASPLSEAS